LLILTRQLQFVHQKLELKWVNQSSELELQNQLNWNSSEILTRMNEEDPLLLAPTDKIEPTNVFQRKFSVGFSVAFFTDGSLLNGLVGAGIYSESQNTGEAYSLGTQATVLRSEVYAICVCSEHCRSLQLRDKIIFLCSDSRASLLALSSHTISSSLISQCWHSL
jgi:hypothetical protein